MEWGNALKHLGLPWGGAGLTTQAPESWERGVMGDTPRLNDKTDSGKTHLQDLAQWLRTSQRVDIPKISQFYWALFEKTRFLCFYIINKAKIPLNLTS